MNRKSKLTEQELQELREWSEEDIDKMSEQDLQDLKLSKEHHDEIKATMSTAEYDVWIENLEFEKEWMKEEAKKNK